jgi:hypothetical protein
MPAVYQVVFSDVQITIRPRVEVHPVLGYWSELCSNWLTQNRHYDTALIRTACLKFRNKINRIIKAIGSNLAFTGKKMFYFN